MAIEVSATPRKAQGTGASRRLRNAGRVPGIIYGANKAVQSIELDHNSLFHQLKQGALQASILDLSVEGGTEQVLLRDVQMHPFRPMVLHVDFQRVSKDEKIHMRVPLHFVNADIAPGVKLGGGIVSHVLSDVEVSCLPADLPESIEVDLANLALGSSIHLSELTLPQGVESIVLVRGDDPVVATVNVPRAAPVEEEEEAAVAPEVAAATTEAEKKEPEKSEKSDKKTRE
ncbi:MAG: 50S ribosomal protein L25/general stress protein Ctc [Pseudomonadota bacterium]|nr:50S ribosomal protein L25/general stress protein Ctc [Burkholderiales bacterium]MDQ3196621.1 50S ribosomal protein L25/general stress protein Ctc [Pseudomonadota bacterium]